MAADKRRQQQIQKITRLSNMAVLFIWLTGIACVCFFLVYVFFISSDKINPVNNNFYSAKSGDENMDATGFADKTALVNMGLKMQGQEEVITTAAVHTGSIRIHKIKYDQQLHLNSTHVTKPVFFIKAVPK